MYSILKSVIESRDFELSDMLKKIDTMWAKGNITEAQEQELIALARENADPAMSVDLAARIDDLDARLRKLEAGGGSSTPTEEYPHFQLHHAYVDGDKITFEGKRYICVLNEYTDHTTWSPKDYPNFWKEVK